MLKNVHKGAVTRQMCSTSPLLRGIMRYDPRAHNWIVHIVMLASVESSL